ncbi:MAG: LptF/LptG family permease, partial [Bacteroidota bacterium]
MKILDKYILKKFLSAYFFVVLLMSAILIVIDFSEKNEDFIKTKPGLYRIFAEYYLNFVPYMANLLSPITIFIATVFVTAQLSGRTEIIAILSSGVSFRRFLYPYIMGAVLIGSGIYILNGYIIPRSNKTRVAFEVKYIKDP